MPAVAAAAVGGELGWAKVRLLAGVVEPESQDHWLGLAREMSVGQLHRVVAAYRRVTDDDTPGPSADARRRRGIWLFDEPDGLVRVTTMSAIASVPEAGSITRPPRSTTVPSSFNMLLK